ncbi:HAD family hydrolase, partial [Staphylococcus epidermidis]
ILAELGLAEAFGVQIYSDEAGIRKPHPQMLCRAAEALGADLAESWYVGDTLDRDVVAGRRAGVGAVILTRSQHTDEPPFPVESQPEAV